LRMFRSLCAWRHVQPGEGNEPHGCPLRFFPACDKVFVCRIKLFDLLVKIWSQFFTLLFWFSKSTTVTIQGIRLTEATELRSLNLLLNGSLERSNTYDFKSQRAGVCTRHTYLICVLSIHVPYHELKPLQVFFSAMPRYM